MTINNHVPLLTSDSCFMKFIRCSKSKGFDVSGVNLGDLMEDLYDL